MTIEKIYEKLDDLNDTVKHVNDAVMVYGYLCVKNINMPMEDAHELTKSIMELWAALEKIVNED